MALQRTATIHNPACAFAHIKDGCFEVKQEDVEYFERIGEGKMAVLYRAKFRNLPCAAKKLKNATKTDSQVEITISIFFVQRTILRKESLNFPKQAYKDLIMELDILATVGKHQNLVEFYGACIQDVADPVIFEEFVDGPNLEQFLGASLPSSV